MIVRGVLEAGGGPSGFLGGMGGGAPTSFVLVGEGGARYALLLRADPPPAGSRVEVEGELVADALGAGMSGLPCLRVERLAALG